MHRHTNIKLINFSLWTAYFCGKDSLQRYDAVLIANLLRFGAAFCLQPQESENLKS